MDGPVVVLTKYKQRFGDDPTPFRCAVLLLIGESVYDAEYSSIANADVQRLLSASEAVQDIRKNVVPMLKHPALQATKSDKECCKISYENLIDALSGIDQKTIKKIRYHMCELKLKLHQLAKFVLAARALLHNLPDHLGAWTKWERQLVSKPVGAPELSLELPTINASRDVLVALVKCIVDCRSASREFWHELMFQLCYTPQHARRGNHAASDSFEGLPILSPAKFLISAIDVRVSGDMSPITYFDRNSSFFRACILAPLSSAYTTWSKSFLQEHFDPADFIFPPDNGGNFIYDFSTMALEHIKTSAKTPVQTGKLGVGYDVYLKLNPLKPVSVNWSSFERCLLDFHDNCGHVKLWGSNVNPEWADTPSGSAAANTSAPKTGAKSTVTMDISDTTDLSIVVAKYGEKYGDDLTPFHCAVLLAVGRTIVKQDLTDTGKFAELKQLLETPAAKYMLKDAASLIEGSSELTPGPNALKRCKKVLKEVSPVVFMVYSPGTKQVIRDAIYGTAKLTHLGRFIYAVRVLSQYFGQKDGWKKAEQVLLSVSKNHAEVKLTSAVVTFCKDMFTKILCNILQDDTTNWDKLMFHLCYSPEFVNYSGNDPIGTLPILSPVRLFQASKASHPGNPWLTFFLYLRGCLTSLLATPQTSWSQGYFKDIRLFDPCDLTEAADLYDDDPFIDYIISSVDDVIKESGHIPVKTGNAGQGYDAYLKANGRSVDSGETKASSSSSSGAAKAGSSGGAKPTTSLKKGFLLSKSGGTKPQTTEKDDFDCLLSQYTQKYGNNLVPLRCALLLSMGGSFGHDFHKRNAMSVALPPLLSCVTCKELAEKIAPLLSDSVGFAEALNEEGETIVDSLIGPAPQAELELSDKGQRDAFLLLRTDLALTKRFCQLALVVKTVIKFWTANSSSTAGIWRMAGQELVDGVDGRSTLRLDRNNLKTYKRVISATLDILNSVSGSVNWDKIMFLLCYTPELITRSSMPEHEYQGYPLQSPAGTLILCAEMKNSPNMNYLRRADHLLKACALAQIVGSISTTWSQSLLASKIKSVSFPALFEETEPFLENFRSWAMLNIMNEVFGKDISVKTGQIGEGYSVYLKLNGIRPIVGKSTEQKSSNKKAANTMSASNPVGGNQVLMQYTKRFGNDGVPFNCSLLVLLGKSFFKEKDVGGKYKSSKLISLIRSSKTCQFIINNMHMDYVDGNSPVIVEPQLRESANILDAFGVNPPQVSHASTASTNENLSDLRSVSVCKQSCEFALVAQTLREYLHEPQGWDKARAQLWQGRSDYPGLVLTPEAVDKYLSMICSVLKRVVKDPATEWEKIMFYLCYSPEAISLDDLFDFSHGNLYRHMPPMSAAGCFCISIEMGRLWDVRNVNAMRRVAHLFRACFLSVLSSAITTWSQTYFLERFTRDALPKVDRRLEPFLHDFIAMVVKEVFATVIKNPHQTGPPGSGYEVYINLGSKNPGWSRSQPEEEPQKQPRKPRPPKTEFHFQPVVYGQEIDKIVQEFPDVDRGDLSIMLKAAETAKLGETSSDSDQRCGHFERAAAMYRTIFEKYEDMSDKNTTDLFANVCVSYAISTLWNEDLLPKDYWKMKKVVEIADKLLIGSCQPIIQLLFCKLYLNRYSYDRASEHFQTLKRILDSEEKFQPVKYPCSHEPVILSTRIGLLTELENLESTIRYPKKPAHVCRAPECPDRIIFYDLDFDGYRRLRCTERCDMCYHNDCLKSALASVAVSDMKDVRGDKDLRCPTPDCDGAIYQIDVYTADTTLKTSFIRPERPISFPDAQHSDPAASDEPSCSEKAPEPRRPAHPRRRDNKPSSLGAPSHHSQNKGSDDKSASHAGPSSSGQQAEAEPAASKAPAPPFKIKARLRPEALSKYHAAHPDAAASPNPDIPKEPTEKPPDALEKVEPAPEESPPAISAVTGLPKIKARLRPKYMTQPPEQPSAESSKPQTDD